MDGLGIKVKTIEGNETTYKLTPRVIVAFEQQYGKGMPKLLGEEQKIEIHSVYPLNLEVDGFNKPVNYKSKFE